LYTAAEYLKLRPVAVEQGIAGFQNKNLWWMQLFFPNATLARVQPQKPAKSQRLLEQILNGRFGLWLEGKLKAWQLPKIRQEQFILVADDELSFHPDSKQQELLQKFFQRASLYT
jgi:hypothetical protein